MKYLRMLFLIGIWLFFFLSPLQLWSMEDSSKQASNIAIDLTRVKIESPFAREVLKKDYIKVRKRRTEYVPSGEVPVLELELVKDEECKRQLKQITAMHSKQQINDEEIKMTGNIYVAKITTASYWISRSSGAYKFTETANSMAVPTKIKDFKQAVQMALDYVGRHRLIELTNGEEVDILFVSTVRNVLTTVDEKKGPEKPIEEFTSDYYVGFGRRYNDIPILDSRLVIRLDGEGNVTSVQKNWRKISKVGIEKARISTKTIQDIIISDPMFYKRYTAEPRSAKDIHIVDKKCGYMESPVNYSQAKLRPGCNISFKIGDSLAESYPQIIIPLEDNMNIETLWGEKASEHYSDMDKRAIYDGDDRSKDELK